MGFLKSLIGAAAPIIGSSFGPLGSAIGGMVGGAIAGSDAPKSQQTSQNGTQIGTSTGTTTGTLTGTQNGTLTGSQTGATTGLQSGTTTNQLNGNIAQLLGLNGGGGLLSGLGNAMGQQHLLSDVGKDFNNKYAESILFNGYGVGEGLIKNPYGFASIQGAQIDAPSQDKIDLSGTFGSLLNGGNNAALRDALGYGTALSSAQFQKNQTDLTNNLTRNVLPSIRSNAIAAGQFGGSRQGIAEGNAVSDYTNQLTNANTQMGLANSANTAAQLASSYEQGQNRSLSAAQGLSAQQYARAAADAAARQAADNTNIQSLLATNQLNSSNKIAGVGLQQGLISNAANYANADLGRLGAIGGILSPYLNAGSTLQTNQSTNQNMNQNTSQNTTQATNQNTSQNSTQNTNNTTTGNVTQPLYQSQFGNMLGGAMAGAGLYNQFGGSSGGGLLGSLGGLFGGSSGSAAQNIRNSYGAGSDFGVSTAPLPVNLGGLLGNWGI